MRKLVRTLLAIPPEFRVVPCRGKIPLKRKWNQREYNYSARDLVNTIIKYEGRFLVQSKTNQIFVQTLNSIGLICGSYPKGYLIAIDCDSREAQQLLDSLKLPKSVAFTSGRKFRASTLYYLDRAIPNFNLNVGLEIRGKNKLAILPPSIHPLTHNEYYWLRHPATYEIAKISHQTILDLNPKTQTQPNYSYKRQINLTEQAICLMSQISFEFGADYHNWIAIGMALNSVNYDLLNVWDDWSSKCDKYVEGECKQKWQSFNKKRQKGGYTIGTLYYFAKLSKIEKNVQI